MINIIILLGCYALSKGISKFYEYINRCYIVYNSKRYKKNKRRKNNVIYLFKNTKSNVIYAFKN